MTKQAPDYLPGWILLAELAYKDKKYDEALSLLENVFSRDAGIRRWPQTAKRCAAGKGRDEKSARSFGATRSNLSGRLRFIKYQLARAYLAIITSTRQSWRWIRPSQLIRITTMPILLLGQKSICATGHAEMVIKPMTDLLQKTPELKKRRIGPGRRLWLP